MDVERLRAFVLALPHVCETMQWGENLVFWVGDKAIGGKMFALLNLDTDNRHRALSYAAGPDRFHELIEREGIRPAPYSARHFWVAVDNLQVFTPAEWRAELAAAHALTLLKLPPKTRAALDLPAGDLARLLRERRKLLAERAGAKRTTPRRTRPDATSPSGPRKP